MVTSLAIVSYIQLTISILLTQTVAADGKCLPAPDCSSCIVQGLECTWCFKKEYTTSQRCGTVEDHARRGCDTSYIFNLESEIHYLKNESVRNADLNNSLEAVQLSPQKIKLTLVPGRPVTVPITFRIAEDYPVDLYYIMDLSYSMLDDRENLIRLGELIAKELKKITRDVRLGFGAFVDKAAMPFAGLREATIANPCYPLANCKPMYGFKNQLSLTSNISIFGQRVRETPISGNQDGPEGGFDALLQAMVCESQIGWRLGSRKIVLFSTDARSHISGDAKLAGILEPNDGHCHLHGNEYTYTLEQDYPSVGQIASEAKKTSTSIIFAVNSFTQEYQQIAELIPSSVVGQLANDSSNIVQLVREKYDSLIKTVKLTASDLSSSDDIKVVLKSNCGSGELREDKVCNSVGIAEKIWFEAEISLTSCKKGGSRTKKFYIKPDDLADSIEVEVEMICDCSCSDRQEKSEHCFGKGTYKCGMCSCDNGFSGEFCECDSKTVKNVTNCVNPLTNVTCSGTGDCDDCGSCQCNCLPGEAEPTCTRYSGDYCQCNTKRCDQRDGKICAGNGICKCDKNSSVSYCECNPGFKGKDCGCPELDLNCKAENGTGKVCNGYGTCNCGRCKCDPCYEGQTCEILKPECSRNCIGFKDCIACKVTPQEVTGCDATACDDLDIKLVSDINTTDSCYYTDQENCNHLYKYNYNHANESWNVILLEEPQCLKDYWLEIIIGLCVGILILGILALIIWKVVVTVHDKREFAKFEKEAKQAQWKSTSNPIYQPATSTFQNPMYTGSSKKPPDIQDESTDKLVET